MATTEIAPVRHIPLSAQEIDLILAWFHDSEDTNWGAGSLALAAFLRMQKGLLNKETP